ncbi:hypothetical protein KKG08_02110, partial [Patescibacteria group bacterium]|nr:hypothetical protein [Patescibacteria group bacterium]
MAHLFELTVDITDGTTAYVTNYLLNERLITKSGQSFGYDHTNRTVLVQVVVPNKSKFKRWLKRRLNN